MNDINIEKLYNEMYQLLIQWFNNIYLPKFNELLKKEFEKDFESKLTNIEDGVFDELD